MSATVDRRMSSDTVETTRDAIEAYAYDHPRATQGEIAEELDTGRSYVAEVLSDNVEVQEVRDVYQSGIEIPATRKKIEAVADAIESEAPSAAARLREGIPFDDDREVDSIEISFEFDDS